MSASDKEQTKKQFQRLIELVTEARFPAHEIVSATSHPHIKVSKPGSPKSPSVILVPTCELLEDEPDHFDSMVLVGIHKAKDILDNPPSPELNSQGRIHLTHSGPIFEKRGR